MKAVITAGGEGSRLRPLTSSVPKAMVPMVNRPLMEHVVRLLKDHGFDDIVVTVAFMANTIRTYFGDGMEFGVKLAYATEEQPLGTAGSLRNARDELGDRFLVVPGDVVTDVDLGALVRAHEERGAVATVGVVDAPDDSPDPRLLLAGDGALTAAGAAAEGGRHRCSGMLVLEPSVFDVIPEGVPFDLVGDVLPALLERGATVVGVPVDGYWGEVATIDAYTRVHRDALDERVRLDIPGFRLSEGVWLGESADLDPDAELEGPALIGDYCRVETGARLGRYTVLGSNVAVRSGADVERSVVDDNAYLGEAVRLRGTVVGRGSKLRKGVRCEDGVVLGNECVVGENAVLTSGVKVYPFKTVDAGAVIDSSIVWESRGARHLFGRDGLAGLANVEVTPEFVTRLAMAYATTLKNGSTVITSRDPSRAGRIMKRALMAGLNAAGVNVLDLEVASIPLTRWVVRSPGNDGGVTIRLMPGDPQTVVLKFFESNGTDLAEGSQRKIERLFYREDYRRVLPGEIGDIGFPPRAVESYAAALDATVDAAAIQGAASKVVVDYAHGTTSLVLPKILARLGVDVLAVNPFDASSDAPLEDRSANAENVAKLVRRSGAELGAVFGYGGERITLIDDQGHALTDGEALLALLSLVVRCHESARVALPVSVGRAAERIAAEAGATILWTKLSIPALMDASMQDGVVFAASQEGGFIFPAFVPAFDAAATFVQTLELLARTGQPLSEVVGALPPVHVAHETVPTPWELKGLVMRTLVEQVKDQEVVLVDGVKVVDEDGWALALPDPEEPVTHVWAEGPSDADARRRAQEYGRGIRHMLE